MICFRAAKSFSAKGFSKKKYSENGLEVCREILYLWNQNLCNHGVVYAKQMNLLTHLKTKTYVTNQT